MRKNKINYVPKKAEESNGVHRFTEKYSHAGLMFEVSGFGATRKQAQARCRIDLLRQLEESGHDPEGVEAFWMFTDPEIESIAGRE